MGTNRFYPEEVKREVIRLKLEEQTSNEELMKQFGIKNKSQIKTWVRWYKQGASHRLAQPPGKQYTFGKGPEEDTEIEQLRKKVAYYEMRDDLMGKAKGHRKEVVPEVIVEVIEANRHAYGVQEMCHAFGIPRSTYYRWKQRSNEIPALHRTIMDLCRRHRYWLGHRKVAALLRKDHGISINRKTAQRVMQKYQLQCRVKPKKQVQPTGETHQTVPNLLQQEFTADRPNQKWVTDITYLPYGEKMWYLSTIMDVYNNELVAYQLRDTQETSLVLDTLEAACRGRETYGLLLHSDQGSQYTSRAFQQAAKEKGIITSMSRKGNCLDNAMIESFHSSLKSEAFSIRVRMPLTSSIIVEKVDSYMYYYNYIRPFTK
ncbi:IS3 family transposase [Marinococcus halophilus]|uniref:IS3 family transposase n=1 Tax=Marinococcus halophilus TaxID=1371 RepID=UPI00361694C9